MPLLQGTLWTLLVCGFRYSNRAATMNGQTVGAKIRRWWWGVNNWKVPGARPSDNEYAEQIKEVCQVWSSGLDRVYRS